MAVRKTSWKLASKLKEANCTIRQPTRIVERKRIWKDWELIGALLHHRPFREVFEQRPSLSLTLQISGPVPIEHRECLEMVVDSYREVLAGLPDEIGARVFLALSAAVIGDQRLDSGNLFLDSPNPLIQSLPSWTLAAGFGSCCWIGAMTFYADARFRRRSFLADRGVRPSTVWWTRVVPPWLAMLPLLAVSLATVSGPSVYVTQRILGRHREDPRCPSDRMPGVCHHDTSCKTNTLLEN